MSEWTRGDAIVQDAKAVLGRMKALGQDSFTRSSLAELIEPFTSRIEYFLKSTVFPTVSRRRTLNDLINDLASLGMGTANVASLHELRLLYNDSKHDTDKELNWRRCVDALSCTVDALAVASRTVVWLSLEQRRFEFVPVFHGLQGRLAAQG